MSVSTVYVTSPGWGFSHNHEQGETWATAHDATSTANYGTTNDFGVSIFYGGGSNSYDIYRRTAAFDTSGIPSNATITTAVFNGYRKREYSQVGGGSTSYLCPVSGTGNAGGYYNQAYFGTAVASFAADGNSDNTNSWWQPSIDVGSIVKAGTTYFGLRYWHDYNNSAPGTQGTSQQYFAANNDATYKSYLTITWTTPAADTTGSATDITSTSATLGGNVTDAGGGTVSERGVCWSTSSNPTTSSSKATSAGTTGSYTVSAGSLSKNTTYHYRAYVITENSTQYGSDQTFVTLGEPSSVTISNLIAVSATGNANTDGNATPTEMGFVVKTSTGPTTSDMKFTTTPANGAYSTQITGLIPGTLYYTRPFITNASGTGYGAESTFRTPATGALFFLLM